MMRDKVVVIRLSSLGDVILSTVIAEVLGDYFELIYLTKSYFKPILEDNPKIMSVFSVPDNPSVSDLFRVSFEVRKENPRFILDAHDKISTYIIRKILDPSGMRTRVWNAQRIERRYALLTKNFSGIKPVSLRFIELSLSIYSSYDKVKKNFYPRVYPPCEPSSSHLSSFLRGVERYVVIAPFASRATKNWDLAQSLKLACEIEKHGITPIFLGNKIEYKNIFYPFHSFFNMNLSDLKYFISRARAVVSVDSGIMHLATALGIPTVAIFTSTVPEMGFAPSGYGRVKVLGPGNINCRPCSLHGKEKCPREHHICSKVSYISVARALFEILS